MSISWERRLQSANSFAILARCLGTMCVLVSLAWSTSLLTLAGYNGIVDPDLAQLSTGEMPLSLYRFFSPSPAFDTALVLLCNSLAVFGALLYWRPRSVWISGALFFALVSFKQTVPLMAYGVFEFLQLALFYLFVGNFATWAFRKGEDKGWKAERLVGWFFRGHLAMAYFFAGISKAIGPQWWTGESMWRALGRTDNSGQRWFDLSWTAHFPVLLQIIGIASFSIETLYPLAFFPKIRRFLIPALILMHLGTIATQGLTLFGLTMICLNVFFWLESAEAERAKRPASQEMEKAVVLVEEPRPVSV